MPRYVYACDYCDQEFQVHHGMSEECNLCEICGEKDTIHRIPQITYTQNKESQSAQRVNQAIEENREILKQASKEAKDNTYDG
tara:strand:+ start:846 stop:1094 length:249 start_codon:yes stop_codon:yes gene_type:complete